MDPASMPLRLLPRRFNRLHIRFLHFLLLMCHFQSVWLQGSLHGLTL